MQIRRGKPDFLVSAAELISSRLKGKSPGVYHRWLKDTVGQLKATQPEILRAVENLGGVLATLNYDGLIEEATGRSPATWQQSDKVQEVLRGIRTDCVLHLHGYYDEPDSVVLGLASYLQVAGHLHTQAVLRLFTLDRTLLFVGCGGTVQDPNFSRLVEWGNEALKHSTHRHFLLCREAELPNVRRDLAAASWLHAVSYGAKYDDMLPFLQSLAPAPGVIRLSRKPKPLLTSGFDVDKYRDGLQKRYAYLRLESLDASPDHQRIALTKIFVEPTVRSCQQFNPRAYELPIEHRRRLKEQGGLEEDLDEEELKRLRESFLQQPPLPALEVVSDPAHRLCVVLGDPGSGKSVLLDYLAMQWAELSPTERAARPVPLLIELKTYAENLGNNRCHDFLEYLDHGTGAVGQLDQHQLDSVLQRGQATFLLDGLDEIFDPPTRQQLVQDIVSFTVRYPQTRFLITSRTIGYEFVAPLLRDASFQHFLLQDLDDAQRQQFIRRWHELAYADLVERAEKSDRLRQSIADVPAIQELAQNPLLLTLMALLNRHQELPRDRNELYEQASRLMLQRWDATRAIREDPLLAQQSFDYKDKQAMLRAVAFRMQTSPKGLAGNVIAADELEQTLVDYLRTQGYNDPRPIAKRLILQLRERNFILCLLGGDLFAFVHRTFLEFFCAWAWVWRFEKEKSVAFEEFQHETFDAHWEEETWHEVLRLIAARLEPRFCSRLIEGLLDKQDDSNCYINVLFAAKCFTDVRNPAGLSRLRVSLDRSLKGIVERRRQSWQVQSETERKAISQAVRFVAQCWPKEPETIAWLRECLNCENPGICQPAVQELARGLKDDPATLPWLKALARSDANWAVRLAAVLELMQDRQNRAETLLILKAVVQSNKDGPDCLAAVTFLATIWKNDPETLLILKAIAQSDKRWALRETAVRHLAREWKDDPETLPFLKAIAQSDESHMVPRAVARELTRGWKDGPDVQAFLEELRRR